MFVFQNILNRCTSTTPVSMGFYEQSSKLFPVGKRTSYPSEGGNLADPEGGGKQCVLGNALLPCGYSVALPAANVLGSKGGATRRAHPRPVCGACVAPIPRLKLA